MKPPSAIPVSSWVVLFALAFSAHALDFAEDFEGWFDGGYSGVVTYTSTNGMWASNNAITSDGWINPDVLPSVMVRFQRNGGADTPWLEYRGLDGNGIDGGVGTVSFDYRHWDGDSNVVAFQFQYSINGGVWVDAGPEVSVAGDIVVREYSRALNLPDDNIRLRVLSAADPERLLIDDFTVTDGGTEPLIRFDVAAATVNETGAPLQVLVSVTPPTAATVDVAQVAGDAINGADFTVAPTTLVFSVGTPTSSFTVNLTDDMDMETIETALFSLTNAVGALTDPASDTFTLTLTDDDTISVAFDGSAASTNESAGSVQVPVTVSRAADVTVDLQWTGSALPVEDYTLSTTTLAFSASGPTSQAVTVYLTDDGATEPAESLTLTLVRPAGATVGSPPSFTLTVEDDDVAGETINILAANLTSGNGQSYPSPGPGTRIMEALNPDIVGIQEFNVSGSLRTFVDTHFGTSFDYMIEGGNEQIPNGIISRWPIIASGEWIDTEVSNRDFAWATIDIPGETDLHVISVHFLTSGSGVRNSQAQEVIAQVQANFPAGDYIALTGDFNTGSRNESAVNTLKTVFFDDHQPKDQNGNDNTNANRNSPYDWVMANGALNATHTPLTVGGTSFPDGIVFDTRLSAWGGSLPAPALSGDSGASMMQHMGVMKAFTIASSSMPRFAALGTPHAWLIGNGFTNNFDAAELLDTDLDGMSAWQEYIAGTSPTNSASTFIMTRVHLDSTVGITIDTQPGRRYTVAYSDSFGTTPGTTSWDPFLSPATGVYDELSPAPGTHTFVDDFSATTTGTPPNDAIRAYRVSVTFP